MLLERRTLLFTDASTQGCFGRGCTFNISSRIPILLPLPKIHHQRLANNLNIGFLCSRTDLASHGYHEFLSHRVSIAVSQFIYIGRSSRGCRWIMYGNECFSPLVNTCEDISGKFVMPVILVFE